MSYVNHTAPLPLGTNGLIGTRSPNVAGPDHLLTAESITYEDELIQKEGGAVKYNAAAITGAPAILAGHDWWPDTATQRMVVYTSAGKLLKDDGTGAFATELKTGLKTNPTYPPVFVEGGKEGAADNRKLFIFNGYDVVQGLAADAATTVDITTPPTDWTGTSQPSFGLIHERRLWGGGNLNDPHRLYYSSTAAHAVFTGTDSGSLSVFPGEGEALVGAVSFGDWIVCWKKPEGIYLVDTTNATASNWRVSRMSPTIGAASPGAFVQVGNEIVFLDRNGSFHTASTVQEYGKIGTGSLSATIRLDTWMRENVKLSALNLCQAIYYPAKREAHFAVTSSGGAQNDRRLIWDFNNPQSARFRYSSRDIPVSLWMRKDTNGILRPVMGDTAGFVWLLDQAARTKAGAAYPVSFETATTDLRYVDASLAGKRKNFEFLELHYMPQGNWHVYVDVYCDEMKTSSVAFFLGGGGGAVLGSTFIIGSAILGNINLASQRRRITGSSRRIRLRVSSSGMGENFALAGALLGFSVADERD